MAIPPKSYDAYRRGGGSETPGWIICGEHPRGWLLHAEDPCPLCALVYKVQPSPLRLSREDENARAGATVGMPRTVRPQRSLNKLLSQRGCLNPQQLRTWHERSPRSMGLSYRATHRPTRRNVLMSGGGALLADSALIILYLSVIVISYRCTGEWENQEDVGLTPPEFQVCVRTFLLSRSSFRAAVPPLGVRGNKGHPTRAEHWRSPYRPHNFDLGYKLLASHGPSYSIVGPNHLAPIHPVVFVLLLSILLVCRLQYIMVDSAHLLAPGVAMIFSPSIAAVAAWRGWLRATKSPGDTVGLCAKMPPGGSANPLVKDPSFFKLRIVSWQWVRLPPSLL